MSERKKIGQLLMELGYVTPVEIKQAIKEQQSNGTELKLGEILVRMGACDAEDVAKGLSKQFGLGYVNLAEIQIPPDLISLLPKDQVVDHNIVPLKRTDKKLYIAVTDPLDFFVLDNLRFILGCEIECVLASKRAISRAVEKYYGVTGTAMDDVLEEAAAQDEDITFGRGGINEDDDDDEDAPIVKLVNQIIADAINARASDIHFEPFEKVFRVRFRVDGVCVEQEPPPKKLQGPILSRLKIMSKMDMAEKRKPQDGRIKMIIGGREIDFRASALPARYGESVVLRVLDREKALVDMEILGFHPTDYEKFIKIIKRPNGIVLVTGPTGSGKTTTLYSALKMLNRPDVKIITAEDPVEYNLSGINQSQVNHKVGLSFSRILRAMLRQAPNVILVGEIRDEETAEVAVQASLTGHLVFSTLHTNDAPSAISRLTDIGVKPFLVASAVVAILAQRLVRKLCPECGVDYDPPAHMIKAVGMSAEQLNGKTILQASGCPKCDHHGYRGRVGVYELLEINDAFRELIFAEKPSDELRKAAIANGMISLQMDGVRKILSKMTTIEEILRITHRQDLEL